MDNSLLKYTPQQVQAVAKSLGITQNALSEATGISQSQISRLLSGRGKRQSKAYSKICNYVFLKHDGITPDLVKNNEEFIAALAAVWDGSAQQSKAISNVILSLGGICANTTQTSKR
jgi:transcriptional regulator with XRE-family HTH domain